VVVASLLLSEGADRERALNEEGADTEKVTNSEPRLLLQHGAKSIEEDESNFQPAANAVLRQWHALSPPGKRSFVATTGALSIFRPSGRCDTTGSTQQCSSSRW